MKRTTTGNMRQGFTNNVNVRIASIKKTKSGSVAKSKSISRILVLIVACVILASFLYSLLASPVEQGNLPAKIVYAVRGPIKIVGDSDFTSANGVVSGSGAPADPFIIDDWEIDASSAIAIDISGTRAYFIIQNCFLKNGSGSGNDGILLDDVENGTVRNSLIINNAHGIHVQSSSHNLLDKNNVSFNGLDGIYLDHSFNNSILNNSCWMNSWNGIFLSISDDNVVEHNTCNNNAWTGIYLEAASDNLIQWNNCSLNSDDGIGAFWNCMGNIIFENVVISNTDYGCSISTSCAGNIIYQNTFIFNRGSLAYPAYNPLAIQGFDNNPLANSWSFGGMGNYWHDWTAPDLDTNGIVDSPYLLDPAGNSDPLPLTNWTVIPEPSILLLSFITIAVCLMLIRQKKRQDM